MDKGRVGAGEQFVLAGSEKEKGEPHKIDAKEMAEILGKYSESEMLLFIYSLNGIALNLGCNTHCDICALNIREGVTKYLGREAIAFFLNQEVNGIRISEHLKKIHPKISLDDRCEPLDNPEFEEILKLFGSCGIKSDGIVTSYPDQKNIEDRVKKLSKIALVDITILDENIERLIQDGWLVREISNGFIQPSSKAKEYDIDFRERVKDESVSVRLLGMDTDRSGIIKVGRSNVGKETNKITSAFSGINCVLLTPQGFFNDFVPRTNYNKKTYNHIPGSGGLQNMTIKIRRDGKFIDDIVSGNVDWNTVKIQKLLASSCIALNMRPLPGLFRVYLVNNQENMSILDIAYDLNDEKKELYIIRVTSPNIDEEGKDLGRKVLFDGIEIKKNTEVID